MAPTTAGRTGGGGNLCWKIRVIGPEVHRGKHYNLPPPPRLRPPANSRSALRRRRRRRRSPRHLVQTIYRAPRAGRRKNDVTVQRKLLRISRNNNYGAFTWRSSKRWILIRTVNKFKTVRVAVGPFILEGFSNFVQRDSTVVLNVPIISDVYRLHDYIVCIRKINTWKGIKILIPQ